MTEELSCVYISIVLVTIHIRASYYQVHICFFNLFQQFPYPEYDIDLFLSSVGTFLPLLFVMAFLYSAGTIVKVIHTTQ